MLEHNHENFCIPVCVSTPIKNIIGRMRDSLLAVSPIVFVVETCGTRELGNIVFGNSCLQQCCLVYDSMLQLLHVANE